MYVFLLYKLETHQTNDSVWRTQTNNTQHSENWKYKVA